MIQVDSDETQNQSKSSINEDSNMDYDARKDPRRFLPKNFYNYEVHGRKRRFAFNSLNSLSLKNEFRQKIIWLIEWKYFEGFITFLIILNSIFLGMMDYTDKENNSFGNKLVENSELIFTVFFTLESVLKIVGLGFIMENGCYLRDAWNWLDFLVVVTALLQVIPGMNNVSGLRTFRLFRPLRSLN